MLQKKNNKIYTYTEYNPYFIKEAKMMGGKWNSEEKSWVFPLDIESEVENLLHKHYGYKEEKVTIVIKNGQDFCFNDSNITMFGRVLFSRTHRDASVKIHNSVSILGNCRFLNSGGSMKHPAVGQPQGEFEILIRDVPKNLLIDIPEDIKWEIKEEKINSKYSDISLENLIEMKKEIEEEINRRKLQN